MTRATLGFDRKIELAWLDAAAAAAARGDTPVAAREYLYGLLAGSVAGDGPHSGRGKTITVLARVWLSPPGPAAGLRTRALALIDSVSPAERMALHWAMCAATHGFFVDVAAAVGQLLKVQGNVSLSQVTRRLAEKWGDRTTLQRAVQRLCRSFVEWGAIQGSPTRGVYDPARARRAVGRGTSRLLIEGILLGGSRASLPLTELARHPALFPFDIEIRVGELRAAPELSVDRQGLDFDVVRLAPDHAGEGTAKQKTLGLDVEG